MALDLNISAVGRSPYDYQGDRTQAVFDHLDAIASDLRQILPSHYLVPVSRGVGWLPQALWVSILDPEVTESPTRGIYVALLFSLDRRSVTLSLNQGVTAAQGRARALGVPTKALLRAEGQAIRDMLHSPAIVSLETEISLGPGNLLGKYEAGNIYGKSWTMATIPSHAEIVSWVERFVDLYAEAVDAKEDLILGDTGAGLVPPRDPGLGGRTRERTFKPKNDADYRANIAAQEQVRGRPHERLVASLGAWARLRGYEPNTNVHPRDLVLHREDTEVLVEVKVFPAGRPRVHVRECIGQLFEYQKFLSEPRTSMLAALSENPGDAYLDLLTSLQIAAMWQTPNSGWTGTELARGLGLVDSQDSSVSTPQLTQG